MLNFVEIYIKLWFSRNAVIKMVNKAKKKKSRSDFSRRSQGNGYGMYKLIGAIGIILILGLVVIIGAQYLQSYSAAQELELFETRIKEHEARQEMLQEEIERLQHLDYIEILARDRLGLVKPGEIIFQLED
jgi:cell division protein DivIC